MCMNENNYNKIELINCNKLIINGALALQLMNEEETIVLTGLGKLLIAGKNIEMISFNENIKKIEFIGSFNKIEYMRKKEHKKKGFINKLIR